MPNKPIHLAVAIPVGTIIAACKANICKDLTYFAEVVGGGMGAAAGGLVPDWVDPLRSPNHRNAGHSVATTITVGKVLWPHIDIWQERLRREADRTRQLQLFASDPLLRVANAAWEVFLRLLAGDLVGFVAGWETHLALDCGTARSLPLLY